MGLADAYCKQWEQGSRYEKLLHLPPSRIVREPPEGAPRRATHTSPIVAAELVAAYQGGATVGELAAWFGVHRSTVRNVLHSMDVAPRPRGLTDIQAEEAVRLYADGLSVAKIACRFGLAPSGIDRLLKRRGVVLRDRHWRAPKS